VITRIREELQIVVRNMAEMSSTGDSRFYNDIEMLIITYNDETINSYHMIGLVDKILDITKLSFIPEHNSEMRRYINIDTRELDSNKSLILGEEFLRQASFMNHLIGSPEYHGYHYVMITNEGTFTIIEKSASLNRLDPSNIMDFITSIEIEEE